MLIAVKSRMGVSNLKSQINKEIKTNGLWVERKMLVIEKLSVPVLLDASSTW